MGVVAVDYLENDCPIYMCAKCKAHVARADHIISKAFKGKTGTAYLFDSAVNFSSGPLENRLLMTGLHVIADIYCSRCNSNLGWRYETAFEESQKYKEGKVILELALVQKRRPLRGSLPVDPPSVGAAALRMAAEASQSAQTAISVGTGVQDEDEEEEEEEEEEGSDWE